MFKGAAPKALLLVVDVQNGFINTHTEHVVESVNTLAGAFRRRATAVGFTRFVNTADSGYARWIGWTRFMQAPENAIYEGVDVGDAPVFIKHGYTAFTQAFSQYVAENGIERLVLCGIATDGCVLKTAVDAFERSIEPLVVCDACASHAGHEVHEAGLLLLGRFIGKGQLKAVADFV